LLIAFLTFFQCYVRLGQGLAVRVFKNKTFARFAAKEGIGDDELKAAVDEMERGLCGYPLGGEVYKKRLARAGSGKSSGYRAIVYYRSGERTFFVYGFAKSDRDNIDPVELRVFKKAAKTDLLLTDEQLEARIKKARIKKLFRRLFMLKYKSKILQMLHEDAVGNFEVGAITAEEMREFDRDCLVQEPQPAPKAVRIKRAAALAD
jgi:hypothetical protein